MLLNSSVRISGRLISETEKPFVIAEMSGNHNQSLERALELVNVAADSGADALKLQTYTPKTITLDEDSGDFCVNDPDSLWYGETLGSLYTKAYTPWEWHRQIFEHAASKGLICFSSPFDETAVDFLESIGAPAYKIASFENNHIPLIQYAAATGKPLIISTGMASISELDRAVSAARASGCKELILLKCTSSYPASPAESNLQTIPHLKELFQCQVGLSDHTMGNGAACAAIALGATVVEKHFTLSRADGGVDSSFSLEPSELKQLVVETDRAWQSLGQVSYHPTCSESKNVKYRRSIFLSKDVSEGELLTTENTTIVRPGSGMEPYHYPLVLGRSANGTYRRGTPLNWSMIR